MNLKVTSCALKVSILINKKNGFSGSPVVTGARIDNIVKIPPLNSVNNEH